MRLADERPRPEESWFLPDIGSTASLSLGCSSDFGRPMKLHTSTSANENGRRSKGPFRAWSVLDTVGCRFVATGRLTQEVGCERGSIGRSGGANRRRR